MTVFISTHFISFRNLTTTRGALIGVLRPNNVLNTSAEIIQYCIVTMTSHERKLIYCFEMAKTTKMWLMSDMVAASSLFQYIACYNT